MSHGSLERDAAITEALWIAERQGRTALPPQLPAGAVRLLIDGREVPVREPLRVEGGRVLIPLREAARQLYVAVVDRGGDRFELIFPTGERRTVAARHVDGIPVVTPEELEAAFGVQARFEPPNLFSLWTPHPSALTTTLVEKPPEQLQEEARWETLARQAEAEVTPSVIPDAARPTIDLTGKVRYTMHDPEDATPFRSVITSARGRVAEFDLRFESIRKDVAGVFGHDYTTLALERPDLLIGAFDQTTSLSPLRTQSDRVNGLRVIKALGTQHRLTVGGGDVETSVSGPAGAVKYLGHLVEAREAWAPTEWLELEQALLYLEYDADLPEQAQTTSFPRENLVSFGGATLRLPRGWRVSTHAARAQYEPDDSPDTSVGDWDWRTVAGWEGERGRLDVGYETIGDRYVSLGNPGNYQDFRGWDLLGHYRLTDRWTWTGSFRRFRDNVDDHPEQITTRHQAFSLTSSYEVTDEQTLNLGWNQFLADPSGPDAGSNSHSNVYRVDYFLPFWFDTRLLANYQYNRTEQTTAADAIVHAAGGALFKSYGRGSSWFLSQQVQKTLTQDADEDLSVTSSFDWGHRITPDLKLEMNATYARTVDEAAAGRDRLSGSAGVRYQLLDDTELNVEYLVNSYDLDTEWAEWPRNWGVFFLVSQSFHVVTPPNFGAIGVTVFEDADDDGQRDPGEAGAEAVRLTLPDGRAAVTDQQGHARFTQVTPLSHRVALDVASVDPDWTLRSPERQVEVRRRRTVPVAFPLIRGATIGGRLFLDENGDGRFQATEEPLEGVAVILMPSETFRRTEADGTFAFSHFLPGRYTVQLFVQDLPHGYELVSPDTQAVELGAGEDAEELAFAARILLTP